MTLVETKQMDDLVSGFFCHRKRNLKIAPVLCVVLLQRLYRAHSKQFSNFAKNK
jgi:hypothetical protein